jgi:hypothetical protein
MAMIGCGGSWLARFARARCKLAWMKVGRPWASRAARAYTPSSPVSRVKAGASM